MARVGKPISPGLIAHVVNGVKGFVNGITGQTWFSPGQPVAPQVPDAERQYEFQPGVNIVIEPRESEPITFPQLRALADSYDILRLCIETRKDQIGALDFAIQPRKGKTASKRRSQVIMDKLLYPDNDHTWSTWIRAIIEDLLVIDAPTVYPRFTRGGDIYSLDLIDGTTIKKIITAEGRTPVPPSPAYMQVLYGVPAVEFNRDQLIYRPRNVRTNRSYGYSPVEQIIVTTNIALRRQVSQLDYFTYGNLPDTLIELPTGWTPDQIEKFQQKWDTIFAGDLANRRKAKFVPSGIKTHPVTETKLQNEFDEWLARIVCYAFSLPPTPFIKQLNRATAETSQESSLQEGLAPLKQWVKELMDYIIAKYFKSPDLEFTWQVGELGQDPLKNAQIHQIYVQSGIMTVDEVRSDLGLKGNQPDPENKEGKVNEQD